MKNTIRILVIALTAFCMTAIPGMVHAQIFPSLTITPDPLDFPDTRVGSTADAMTLTVTANAGSLPAYIFNSRIGDTQNFSITNDGCESQVLEAGDSCQVILTFTPSASGHYYTPFAIVSVSQEVLDFSMVEGRGVLPRVVLSATNIDFGDQTVGKASTPHEVLLTNAGNTELLITSIEGSDNFAVTDDCGASVAAEGSCNLEITFTPPAAEAYTGSVTITDDASDSPQTISLAGTGVVPGQPDASLSRHSVDFANQLAGTTSAAEQVTLKNTGTVAMTINNITASANFAVTDDCGVNLAVDATCTLNITFSPNQAGAFSGTVTLDDDASDSPQTIGLTGQGIENGGPQASLSTNAIDFGEQAINTMSEAQTVTVTNSGDEDLIVQTVELGGDNPDVFTGVDNCEGNTLSPGENCDGSVQFKPTTKAVYNATITITDNSAGSPQIVTLTGIGLRSSGGCSIATGAKAALGIVPIGLIFGLIAIRRRRR